MAAFGATERYPAIAQKSAFRVAHLRRGWFKMGPELSLEGER